MPAPSVLRRNDGNAPHKPGSRVRAWLHKAGLGLYHDVFASVNEHEFGALGMVDFVQFGVTDVAHKQTLFRLIKNLNLEGVFGPNGDDGVAHGLVKRHVIANDVNKAKSTARSHARWIDASDESETFLPADPVRTSHGLLDVHAEEHDEFLLSPMAKGGLGGHKNPFVPSPTALGNDDVAKKESPLEQLRQRSREHRTSSSEGVGVLTTSTTSGPVVEQTTHAVTVSEKSEKVPAKEKEIALDPSKTPFTIDDAARRTKNQPSLQVRQTHHNLVPLPADQPRIRVVVRKRPLNAKELSREETDVVTVDTTVDASDAGPGNSGTDGAKPAPQKTTSSLTVWEPKTKVDLTEYTETHTFTFDDVYSPDVSNDTVYRTTVAPLVGTIFDKCKVTCFAYGQTGSGKTYTMNPLPIRACSEILNELNNNPKHENLSLCVSYFEIYGGKVYDLLNGREKLVIREDARSQMCVVGLKEFPVFDVELVEALIDHGSAARCVGSTGANAESSRSHAIMQFVLRKKNDGTDDENKNVPEHVLAQRKKLTGKSRANHAAVHGKLSFVDLAGSERGADTSENDAKTRLEGAEINKSLLALKECIRALDRGSGHVPFRGSKLTEVLRDSFMGDSRTVMIANISPATGSCEHTLNTLRYAYRVKELRGAGDALDNDGTGSGSNAGGVNRPVTTTNRPGYAPDGVTPVGGSGVATVTLQSDKGNVSNDKGNSSNPGHASARERGGQSRIARAMSAGGNVSARGGSAGGESGPNNESSSSDLPQKNQFDPRAAAKAAAARVRDAVRRSAESEALVDMKKKEKEDRVKAFLTKGGGGGGGVAGAGGGGVMSPRKERPRSAMPGTRPSTATYTELLMGKRRVGGSTSSRPQTARGGNRNSLGGHALPSDRPSTASTRRRETFCVAPLVGGIGGSGFRGKQSGGQQELPVDPKTTAFSTKALGTKRGLIAKINEEVVGVETQLASPVKPRTGIEPATVRSKETRSPTSLKPVTGSALAAAQARAFAAGIGPPIDIEEMAKAHDELINVILEEEELVIQAHRTQIESTMDLVKKEMSLLAEVDKPGSAIDLYVNRLADVLEKKRKSIEDLQRKVAQFQTHLREEEVLSTAVGLR